jgi:predicted nucleotidyltransferase
MCPFELSASTNNSQIDLLLQSLVGIYQAVFSERVRCLYVVGSFSDGSAVPGSDLDVGVVFKEPLTDEQLVQFRQINQFLAQISLVRLDCGTVNPQRFTHGIPAGLKAALVVYGEKVFDGLPLEPIERALRRGMSNTFHSLYILRQRDERLVYPLKYPDPAGEFYGYERWGTYLGERVFAPGVRSLVTSVTLIASCLVMLQASQPVASK